MTANSVSSILSTISNQYTATETEKNDGSLYMDDFLNVFLAQLEYQDPLNPMEGTDMTTQLAQISSVEQQYNANEKLDTISEKLEELSSAGFLQYIGKDIQLDDGSLTVENGEPLSEISFPLEESAQVVITICDSEGNEIRRIEAGQLEAGSHQIEWDGKDSEGNTVADGAIHTKSWRRIWMIQPPRRLKTGSGSPVSPIRMAPRTFLQEISGSILRALSRWLSQLPSLPECLPGHPEHPLPKALMFLGRGKLDQEGSRY